MWRWQTAVVILAIFVLTAIVYWFASNYLDPAGTVLLLFMGAAMGFGYFVIFRGSPDL